METLEAGLSWEESLARIRTLADIAEGLSLVFVFGPGHLARQGLKQVMGAIGGKRRVLWHRLDRLGAALSDSLATAGGEPVVLLVHGMEFVERERRREIEIELNTGRNTLSSFDALVVFWIPEAEREDLFRFCADLLHWRTLVITATADKVGFDVFLSHASADKLPVEALARRLRDDGLEPFLDQWHLVPGEPWQEALEDALETSRTCAVFVSRKLGPWQNEEMRVALDKRVRSVDFRVIPVLLPGASRPGGKDLPRFLRRLSWVDFRTGLNDDYEYQRLLSGIRGVAPGARTAIQSAELLYRAKLPPHDFFVHRRELEEVRDLLIGAAGSTVGITTALRGAGGFGKTALARALCDDPEVRATFPDGILWTTMGERLHDVDRIDRVLDLVRWWTDEEPPGFKSSRDAGAYLKKVLAGRRVLVVVDDVWQGSDLEPFRELEPGAVLATTRNVRALPEGTQRIDVDAMASGEAVALLAHGLPPVNHGLAALAERLGKWPLLLRLVSSQLLDLIRERGLEVSTALKRIDSRLGEAGLRAFDRRDATGRGEALSLTMNVSLDALSPVDRQKYLDLAVLPEDIDVPIRVVERFWSLEAWEAEDLCQHLDDFSLLLDFDVARQTIRLHDVVRQYLIGEHSNLPALHRRLLARCRPPSGRWTDLADDEAYLWRHLAEHLVETGERAELRRLLLDLDYLEGKLRAVGINALLADYDVLGETGEARAVQEALRLSAHMLTRAWYGLLGQQLAGQLLGRLDPVGYEERRLVEKAADRAPLRPRRVSMSRTGGPLIRTLEGHSNFVNAVAIVDDTHVISASSDCTLRLWNLSSGDTIHIFEGHTDRVNAVAMLDETCVISGSSDHTMRVWDVESGESIGILKGPAPVRAVAVLDKTRVVSASFDRTLRVWDTATGKPIRTFQSLALHPVVAVLDKTRLVSVSADHALRILDVESGETTHILKGHTNQVRAVAVLDGTHVVSASIDRTLRVWDVSAGDAMHTIESHTDRISAVAVLDEARVVTASQHRTLQIWDLPAGKMIYTLEGHTEWVNAVAVLSETRVVSASNDGTLRLWNVGSVETTSTEVHTSAVNAVKVLDEARVVSASHDRTLCVWDIASGEMIRALEGRNYAVNAVAVMNETCLVEGGMKRFRPGATPPTLQPILTVLDVASGEILHTLEGHADQVTAVAVLDEARVVSASSDRTLRIWDVESGETIRTLEGHVDRVDAVAVLNETCVVSGSWDRTLRIWDVESGETIRTLEGHLGGVHTVAVLDETRVVSGSDDCTLHLWDVGSGETISILEGHTHWVREVAALDETRVISASFDRTLRVWDVASGETMAVFALDAPLCAVAVTLDGRTVIAGDKTGGVHFLDLEPP